MLDVKLCLRFVDETLDIEMVVEAEREYQILCMLSLLKNLQSRAALCETYFHV